MCMLPNHLCVGPRPTRTNPVVISSHDEVLANVGLTGKRFTVKHKDQVIQMTRAFLDYMKSLRLQAPEAINPVPITNNNDDAGSKAGSDDTTKDTSLDIKMTAQGYPILPISIMDTELSKSVCESLMRAYVAQHYCKFSTVIWSGLSLIHINRFGKREEELAGTIQRFETRYNGICNGGLSPCWFRH